MTCLLCLTSLDNGNAFFNRILSAAVKLPQIPHLSFHPSSKQKPLTGQLMQTLTAFIICGASSASQKKRSGLKSKQRACVCQSSGFGQVAQMSVPEMTGWLQSFNKI